MQRVQWAWLAPAALVGAGLVLGTPPVVAFGMGLAASLSLAGSI